MSTKRSYELKKLVKDLGKLISESKTGEKDRKLKGLLLHLKKEILRNNEMAVNFRELDGLKLICNILQSHTAVRDSIVALCLSLSANLSALDPETKKHLACSERAIVLIEILEQTQSNDVINCGSRLLGNTAPHIKPHSGLHVRIPKIIVYYIGTVEDTNCRLSLLRTIRILARTPSYRVEMLKLDVICYVCQLLESQHRDLVTAVLQVLSVLCSVDTEAVLQLTYLQHFPCLVSLLADADLKVSKTATSIVLSLANVSECKGIIGSSGGIEKLLDLVKTDKAKQLHIHTKIIKSLSLCCQDVICRQKLKHTGGLHQLVSELKMEEYPFGNPVVTSILSGLLCYYFDDPSLQFMVHKLDLTKVLALRLEQMTAEMERKEQIGSQEDEVDKDCKVVITSDEGGIESDRESSTVSDCLSYPGSEFTPLRDSSPHPPSDLLSSTESSRSSTPVSSGQDEDSILPQNPGPSKHPNPLSPEWNGGVYPVKYCPINDSFSKESCHDTSVFEGILKTLAVSPPSSSRGGVSCASPEGFEPTPHDLIDSLLTAPSPYSASSPPTRPDTRLTRGESPSSHPLLALISRLSFLPDCLPSLAQHSLLLPLMKYFSLTRGQDQRCFTTLNRIFKNHHCLSDCISCLCAPYVWVHICMRSPHVALPPTDSHLGGLEVTSVESTTTDTVASDTESLEQSSSTSKPIPSTAVARSPQSTDPHTPSTVTLTPASTVSHTPTSTVSHTPVSTGSHTPATTGSHTPASTVSHTPATTGSHTPASTGSHTPATTVSHTPASTGSHTPASTGSHTPATTVSHTLATTVSHTPASTGSHTPATTVSHTPASTGSHTPASTGSHTPATTVSHTPATTVSHTPATTVSHTPASTVSHTPVSTGSNTPTLGIAHCQNRPSVPTSKKSTSFGLMETLILTCNKNYSPSLHRPTNPLDLTCATSDVFFPKRGMELLENLANVAMSPYGTGLLANMLQRGSEKEKMAAALSVPFLTSDPKVMVKMMATYNGFDSLADILLRPEEHSDFVDIALETLSVIVQWCKIRAVAMTRGNPKFRRKSEGGMRSEATVVHEIAQVTASLHPQDLTPPPTYCLTPPLNCCPYANVQKEYDSSEQPIAKRSKFDLENQCCYTDALENEKPDVVFKVEVENEDGKREEVTFEAHKSILSSKSAVFEAMFTSDFRESRESCVILKDVTSLAFKGLLHHTYGCRLNCPFFGNAVLVSPSSVSGENPMLSPTRQKLEFDSPPPQLDANKVTLSQQWDSCLHVDMLILADQYFLEDLRRDCEDVLSLNINKETVVDLFMMATHQRATSVQAHCIEFLFSITSPDERARVARQLMSSGNMDDALKVLREITNLH